MNSEQNKERVFCDRLFAIDRDISFKAGQIKIDVSIDPYCRTVCADGENVISFSLPYNHRGSASYTTILSDRGLDKLIGRIEAEYEKILQQEKAEKEELESKLMEALEK